MKLSGADLMMICDKKNKHPATLTHIPNYGAVEIDNELVPLILSVLPFG